MRKELLEKFIDKNFDLNSFFVDWKNDYLVDLVDMTGSRITLMCMNPEEIWTSINGVKFLSYRLKGNEFIVIN